MVFLPELRDSWDSFVTDYSTEVLLLFAHVKFKATIYLLRATFVYKHSFDSQNYQNVKLSSNIAFWTTIIFFSVSV